MGSPRLSVKSTTLSVGPTSQFLSRSSTLALSFRAS
uniref:Uncharacterized protein n=1 Tax=Rhizophora mucronata TaxID=61149 RepID=A0A2P2PZI5_RHIMU